MDLLAYIERGGIIVNILIVMNIIGVTIMIWKSVVLFVSNRNIKIISNKIVEELESSSNNQLAKVQSAVAIEVKNIELGLNTVKIIASLSPLIGLLGTVIGILDSFDSISHLGLGDPTIFSGGISIALITTVAGLIVAIPHYIGYNYFIGSLDKIEIKIEKAVLDKIK